MEEAAVKLNVLEIAANMVRNAVDTMSSKFSAFVKDEINAKISTLYKPGGNATLATLPALTADNAGYVYDMLEAFTTSASFREGAGHKYPAGTNVVVSDVGDGVYKYDVLSGMLDGYVQESRKVGNVPLSADIPVTLTGDTAITVTNTGTASAIGYSIAHKDSGVTAGSKGDTANQTPGFGDTFKVLSASVDAKGHVTVLGEHTAKIPDAEATQNAKGLMSASDKTKLDTLVDDTLSATGKAADAKVTGDAIAALRDYLKSMDVSRTASGNPATFSDAEAANVSELVVTITPTQSGSGDPYPPGGGKNLLDASAFNTVTDNGITFTVLKNAVGDVVEIDANGTSTDVRAQVFFAVPDGSIYSGMILSGCPGGSGSYFAIEKQSSPYMEYVRENGDGAIIPTIPDGEKCVILWRFPNAGTTANHVKLRPMIRRASDTDPTFAPYSNIRPISGVSSVSVTRTGKNLLPLPLTRGAIVNGVDEFSFVRLRSGFIPCKPGEPVTLSLVSGTDGVAPYTILFYDANKVVLSWLTTMDGVNPFTVTAPNNAHYCRIVLRKLDNANMVPDDVSAAQLEMNAATDYEPYQGQTVTVQLTDATNPLTVYGGTLDVMTGELSVTHAKITLDGSKEWAKYGNNSNDYSTEGYRFFYMVQGLSDYRIPDNNEMPDALCDTYATRTAVALFSRLADGFALANYPGWAFQKSIVVRDSNHATKTGAEFTAWLRENPVELLCPLTTPVTYQLTPAQLATLSGYNAVSSDAGTVSVTYKADTSIIWGGG